MIPIKFHFQINNKYILNITDNIFVLTCNLDIVNTKFRYNWIFIYLLQKSTFKLAKTHTILIQISKCYMHQNYQETLGSQTQNFSSWWGLVEVGVLENLDL